MKKSTAAATAQSRVGREARGGIAVGLIRQIRGVPGWTIERIGRELGVNTATVSRWANAKSSPTSRPLERLEVMASTLIGAPPRAASAEPGEPDPVQLLDQRWRRVYERLREQRDGLLMLVLDFDQRLVELEARVGGRPRQALALDAFNRARVEEAIREARAAGPFSLAPVP